jgi:hypothetical protein
MAHYDFFSHNCKKHFSRILSYAVRQILFRLHLD